MKQTTHGQTTGSWQAWHDEGMPIRLGVSSCLLGEEVRFDGGHKRDRFVVDQLGRWVEWVSVCPEVDIGLGIPRPTIRLVQHADDAAVRLLAPSTGEDVTSRMRRYAKTRVKSLRALDLDGYVLKKNSPSCGMTRLPVYRNTNLLHKHGVGLFAQSLIDDWPALPIEEDGRLNDARLRETFIERIFCRHRWRTLVRRGLRRGRLVEFHTAHKLLIRAHNEASYARLGRLVANAGRGSDRALYDQYELELQTALRTPATTKKHTNVLQHAMGHLKQVLSPAEKQEILSAIEDFRHGLLPLVVPATLMRFNIRLHGVEYLAGQLYFDPHPKELMLRNHV